MPPEGFDAFLKAPQRVSSIPAIIKGRPDRAAFSFRRPSNNPPLPLGSPSWYKRLRFGAGSGPWSREAQIPPIMVNDDNYNVQIGRAHV